MNPDRLIKRKQRILDTASRLIAHYGFDKTTMQEIARESGVSKGALYLLWSSKDDLFDSLLAHEMLRLLEDLEQRLRQDPQGGLIPRLYMHTLLALQNNPLVRALYVRDQRLLGDFVHRQDPNRYTSRLILSQQTIALMQAAGLLRQSVTPQVMAYLFSAIAVGMVEIGSLLPSQAAPPLEEQVAGLVDLMEHGWAIAQGESQPGKPAPAAAEAKAQMITLLELMKEQYRS